MIALAVGLSTRATPTLSQDTTIKPTVAPTALAGTIRDSLGAPVADAEVVLRETGRSVRTDSAGRFALSDVPPALYQVWFRKLGYASAQFTWAARTDERLELSVTLHLLAHTLDPVVIRAQEERRMRGASVILGYVVDSIGKPVPEAEVQLVGADRVGLTRDDGGFAFRGLPIGEYIIRVRKLGYSPNTVVLDLKEGDEREFVVKIRQLATTLEPVVINERSGYGRDQAAWDRLETRKRWRTSARDVVAGPVELRRYTGMPFDRAMTLMGVGGAEEFAAMQNDRLARVVDASTVGGQTVKRLGGTDENAACILINGRDFRREPLRLFKVADVELVEVYPSGEDPGHTLSPLMGVGCKSGVLDDHPTWYVIWFRGAR